MDEIESKVEPRTIDIVFDKDQIALNGAALSQLDAVQVALLGGSVDSVYSCTGSDEVTGDFAANSGLMSGRMAAVGDALRQNTINNFEDARENALQQASVDISDGHMDTGSVAQMYDVTILPAFENLSDQTTAAFNAVSRENTPIDMPCFDGAEQGKVTFVFETPSDAPKM